MSDKVILESDGSANNALPAVIDATNPNPDQNLVVPLDTSASPESKEYEKLCTVEFDNVNQRIIFHWKGGEPNGKHVGEAMRDAIVMLDKTEHPIVDVAIDWGNGEKAMYNLVALQDVPLIIQQIRHPKLRWYILCGGFPSIIRLIANRAAAMSGKFNKFKFFETYEQGKRFLDRTPITLKEQ